MAESQIRGKSILAVAKDIAEGFFSINPLVLKKFGPEDYKGLHHQLKKLQNEVRSEKFPLHDTLAIRGRNNKLQRLHSALIVLEHSARERKVVL
jgi:hypothetical protein